MNPAIIPILSLVVILNFIIGIIILSRGLKDKVNLLFGLISLGVSLWALGILGFYLIKIRPEYLWIIETHSSAALFAVIFVLFTFNFPTSLIKKTYIRILPLLPFFIILYYLFFTKDVIGNVHGLSYEINNGYLFYTLYIMLYFFVGYIALFLQYKKSSNDEQRIQVKYVLVGAVLSSFLASVSDLILPYFGIFQYNWLGPIFTFFLVGAIAYAILKHHLFNIKVVATELFTFAVWIILLVKIFFSNGTQDILINVSLLLSVVFFGIMVIRGVIREIKHREEMEKIEKEIERAYEVEKRANEELKNLDRVKNQFLMQAQHDLRSPLSIIRGYCDLLIGGTLGKQPKKTVEVLQRIESVAEEKIKDVNNFLDLTQFRLGKAAVDLKPGVEMVSMIDEIVATFKLKSEQAGIYLKFDAPKEEIILTADMGKLKSAIFNVVDNCVKFTKTGGVTIKMKTENGKAKIEIKDTGIGIPAEKLKTIFEDQFERTEQAQKIAEGKGVGLYLSAQIIKYHNGKIWVESEGEGRGSTFFIELPAGDVKD